MSNVIFLADAQDPTTLTTFYGRDHQASITDENFVRSLIASGRAAYLGILIRGISVRPIATTTATVNWQLDQPCASARVDYGTTTAYGSTLTSVPTSGAGAFTAPLTGLTTGTLYHYRVVVTQPTTNFQTISPDLTFRTL